VAIRIEGTEQVRSMETSYARVKRLERLFEIPVMVAALLVIPVVVLDATPSSSPWRQIAVSASWAIWLVFAAELIAYLAVVPRRWQWVRKHPLEVFIVLLTPPFLPASFQAIRALRLLRLVRLLRLAQISRRFFSLEGLRYAALIALLTVLGGGAAFSAVEEGHSTWEGVWWASTALTTVGGNPAPSSAEGRAIAIVVALIGLGFVAVLTGAVAQRFLRPEIQSAEAEKADFEAIMSELRQVTRRLAHVEDQLERLPPPTAD
jgi:voltage-gated potassium channel